MKIAKLILLLSTILLSGCAEKYGPDLEEDADRLAKLPALTSTAIVLKWPIGIFALGFFVFALAKHQPRK